VEPKVTPHPDGPIPPDDNPYWHDAINVGFNLGTHLLMDNLGQVEVMSYNTFDKYNRKIQVIDRETGERWVVQL